MKKILFTLIVFLLSYANLGAENKVKRIFEGKEDSKITILVYESLTCSHCAKFHSDVYPDLKKNIEDFVLEDRIEGVKKYNVSATPTLIINGEKFEKSLTYKNLEKTLEKLL